MIVVKPTTLTPAEKHTAIQEVIARLEATHPHQFVNCPSCEGVGYHESPWAHGSQTDKVPCPCCDGSGLVLPEERDNWFEFEGGVA
jgi:hypothetical protein